MTQTTMYAGHVNSPFTLLSEGITDVATTIPVLETTDYDTLPMPYVLGTGSDAETVLVTARSVASGAGDLTVTRGWNTTGTYGAAKEWLAGTVISRRYTEYDHATFKANIEDHETWKISKAIVDAKGDLIVGTAADTVARHAVGTDLYPLVAKSAVTNGMAWEQLTEAGIVLADVTTLDVSITKHGLVPKAPNDTSQYLRGDGTWSALTTPDVLIYKGVIDCAANPNYPAADTGHTYLVSVAGKIGGASGPAVEAGDMIVCCVDSSASGDHATVGANWSVLQSVVTETNLTLADVTTNDASTTKHGFAPKATAPAAGIINLLGIANGETAYTCKALLDDTNPEALGTAGPGTQLVAARRDHVHQMPTLDGVAAPTDVTTLDASTTAHGLILKATAPAAGIRNVVAIDNAETVYKNTALVDTTNPEVLGTAGPGSSLIAARRDHVHTMPTLDGVAAPTDVTTLNVSASAHGLCPKFPNNSTTFFRGDGTYAAPPKGGVLSWSEVTETTQALAVNVGYILNHATTMIVATLPATAAVGDVIRIVGKGAGMWKVAQNASQYIRFAGLTTTTGTGGYLQAENAYDCIEIMCTTANNGWIVISSMGNIVVV